MSAGGTRRRRIIFDCDGVLSDTERYGHLPAFNQTFEEFGLPVRWSEDDYAGEAEDRWRQGADGVAADPRLRGCGRPAGRPGRPLDEVRRWHARKTAIYTELVRSGALPPRPGIRRVTEQALEAGWELAVASTSAEDSVRAVLEHAVGEDNAPPVRGVRR